ncbi:MAG: hypothetical protein D6781_14700 [Verrucomicrobia bacterium]|nr:MAG: hypothetical protein D6781_14700 [Verrucomicrobiota bacterium]
MNDRLRACWVVGGLTLAIFSLSAQEWTSPVRGSWVQAGAGKEHDIVLADAPAGSGCEIVVAPGEHSAVHQAAEFLAADIARISGYRPPLVAHRGDSPAAIHLVTLTDGVVVPPGIDRAQLAGQWEAYQVLSTDHDVWLVGSNFRGTAFAAYTLSERLGIDPLYHWTGYEPEHHPVLILRQTDFRAGPPVFRYRGFFHDDEDILPRPLDANGYPDGTYGSVATEWYERFFETALRLRLNQVAPYTRVRRRFEIQKMASDWGLYYSSHHYDILLSNPWGFKRHGLADSRRAGGKWDWYENREGMLRFWRAGVEENKSLDCIWPVGLRNNDDKNYAFPAGTPMEEKRRVFGEVIAAQVEMTKNLLPPGKDPVFHLTMYNASLDIFQSGPILMPPEVIQVWNDDGIGHMRALPAPAMPGRRHGVYYHLAYVAWPLGDTVQSQHVVAPSTIASQFRDIVNSGATEYMLLNVSELREFIMEARMIAEICWDSSLALGSSDPAGRYIGWWAREYFGDAAVPHVVNAYRHYYALLDTPQATWWDSDRVKDALGRLYRQFVGLPTAANPDMRSKMRARDHAYGAAFAAIAEAKKPMSAECRQFFYEHVEFPLLIGARQLSAALKLETAADTSDPATRETLCKAALADVCRLEAEIARAERPPFTGWYRNTWVRRKEHETELHRSFRNIQAYCDLAFEDSDFTRHSLLEATSATLLAGTDRYTETLAETAVSNETLKFTIDFRVHQDAFRSEPFFHAGIISASNTSATPRLAARAVLNSWAKGSFDAWASMEPLGVYRAASAPMAALGWDTNATPIDRDSEALRLIFTARHDTKVDTWITRCSILNRESGYILHSVDESVTAPSLSEDGPLKFVLAMDGPHPGTFLHLDRVRVEKLTPHTPRQPSVSGFRPPRHQVTAESIPSLAPRL